MSETYRTKPKKKESEVSIEQLEKPQNILVPPVISSRPKLSHRPSHIVIVSTNSAASSTEHFVLDHDFNERKKVTSKSPSSP